MQTTIRPGLSLAQHEQLGPELQELRARLGHVHQQLATAYGPRAATTRAAGRALTMLAELSAELVQAAGRDFPEHPAPALARLYQQPPAAG